MPYDDETGHSYFESNEDANGWLSLYMPEIFFYPSPTNQRPRIVPIEDDTSSSPTIPPPEFPLCLQCSDHHCPNAIVSTKGVVHVFTKGKGK
jgi:hypothetical protein